MNGDVGIAGYGCYVPRLRIKVEEISRVWGKNAENIKKSLLIEEKSVPDADEDTITISVEAGKNAIKCAGIDAKLIGALFIGSESHPYVVKPSGTVVSEALCLSNNLMMADLEFACKAGTAAMQICHALVKSGEINYGMAIGADTSQGRPGDALEYTAAAGGAAFIIGREPLAVMEATCSFATDTPDFWRREGEDYPRHGARFTGEPAYFKHVQTATDMLLEKTGFKPTDFSYVVFHMPNGKFPTRLYKKYGFGEEQWKPGFVVQKIGNCYSGSSILGLCGILDIAKPGERILMTSFGSGAGADSFSFLVTDKIIERRKQKPTLDDYIREKKYIDYGMYVKLRKKLIM
ncbi:MAG: hydroxymethylglutaryl-CoA synthase [Candidatus Aenigmatarchaeota archaeon]